VSENLRPIGEWIEMQNVGGGKKKTTEAGIDVKINVKAYTDPLMGGVVYLPVVRLEQEDDGSITAVVSLPNNK